MGDYIWYSTSYRVGEKGMVEYDTKSNKVVSNIPYPHDIQPWCQSVCRYQNNIYIVNGWKGQIITFNTQTKQFCEILNIPEIGNYSSSIMIDNEIHIFNGDKNCDHIVFNPKTQHITTFKDYHQTKGIRFQSILKYNSGIIRFGGLDCKHSKYLDEFVIGLRNRNPSTCDGPYTWNVVPSLKLPLPLLIKRGYILYHEHIVIIFGGYGNRDYGDRIYLSNLNNSQQGWIEIKDLQCPLKSAFQAILLHNNVHLLCMDNHDKAPNHYVLEIDHILGDVYSTTQRKDNAYDGDVEQEEMKKSELHQTNLENENKELKKQNELLRKEMNIYSEENKTLKRQNKSNEMTEHKFESETYYDKLDQMIETQ
eukprot:402669_1